MRRGHAQSGRGERQAAQSVPLSPTCAASALVQRDCCQMGTCLSPAPRPGRLTACKSRRTSPAPSLLTTWVSNKCPPAPQEERQGWALGKGAGQTPTRSGMSLGTEPCCGLVLLSSGRAQLWNSAVGCGLQVTQEPDTLGWGRDPCRRSPNWRVSSLSEPLFPYL